MLNLGLIKLFVDAALVMSLLFLCFRFMRGGRSPTNQLQVEQLERALRALVGEAEEAGRTLDSQLQRRKGELEQALFDIDLAENRLKRAVSYAKESASDIISVDRPSSLETMTASKAPSARPAQPNATQTDPKKSVKASASTGPTPRLRSEIIVDDSDGTEEQSDSTPLSWGNTNIFGQPLGEGPDEEILEAQHEVGRESPVTRANLEQIHSGAEEALQVGRELQAATARQLSSRQQIEVSREEEEVGSEQEVERLGVLAPIRRHTQVV